jgi:drug/metabolite transporter (DMT)-like permease
MRLPLSPLSIGITGYLGFAILGGLIKLLRLDLDPLTLAVPWIGMNAVLAGVWIVTRQGWRGFHTKLLGVHLVRAVVMFVPFLASIYAMRDLTLSLHNTLMNTAPFFLMLLATFWLHEQVGRREWTAVGLGFVGMLICLRPGMEGFTLLALAPLVNAFAQAVGNAWVRRHPEESAVRWVFYQESLGATLAALALVMTDGPWIPAALLPTVGMMVSVDMLAMVSTYYAFSRVEASRLSPWIYVQIPASAVVGWLLFQEVPEPTTVLGAALIIAGGWLTIRR